MGMSSDKNIRNFFLRAAKILEPEAGAPLEVGHGATLCCSQSQQRARLSCPARGGNRVTAGRATPD